MPFGEYFWKVWQISESPGLAAAIEHFMLMSGYMRNIIYNYLILFYFIIDDIDTQSHKNP